MPSLVEPLLVRFVEAAGDAELFGQLVERHAVQRIELSPWQLAGAHPVHRRRVKPAPFVGELLPVDVDALALAERAAVGSHRAAPIDHRAEDIEYQRLDLRHPVLAFGKGSTRPAMR